MNSYFANTRVEERVTTTHSLSYTQSLHDPWMAKMWLCKVWFIPHSYHMYASKYAFFSVKTIRDENFRFNCIIWLLSNSSKLHLEETFFKTQIYSVRVFKWGLVDAFKHNSFFCLDSSAARSVSLELSRIRFFFLQFYWLPSLNKIVSSTCRASPSFSACFKKDSPIYIFSLRKQTTLRKVSGKRRIFKLNSNWMQPSSNVKTISVSQLSLYGKVWSYVL